MKAGALDYLQKLELNRDTLQRAVRMALQQSRLRQLEARLQHKERRDAMGQLAASVAHEINNPASCLLNNMTVALERVTELKQRHVAAPESTSAKLLDELDECIRDSLAGVRSISQVTKDFGDLAHSGPKQRVCLNLSELAEHTVKLLAAKAGGRCELTVQAACGPHVLGNRSQLMQAIMNLVDNAIEAIPPGAPDQNWVRVSVTATATSVRLHVDDSGSGVPEPLLPRLFEPFFTTKPRGQGVGLALTLTQSIARAHAGRLEFERLLGGSRFSLVLPRDCHDRSRLSRPAVPRAEPSGGKLLIIDDEGAVLRSLKRVLQTHYEVITAANAKSAYAAANTHDFDAVLCDLSMPGEDGVDVFRHLSEAHPQLARTLMFLSAASASDGLRQKAITTCRPVLSKPIEAQKLIEAIERCKFERGPGADSSAPPA
jgi:signal transduction histidine kinase/CheY-like chemotaxis protein